MFVDVASENIEPETGSWTRALGNQKWTINMGSFINKMKFINLKTISARVY